MRVRTVVLVIPFLLNAVACSPAPGSSGATPTTVTTATSTTTTTLPVPAEIRDVIEVTTMTEQGRRTFLAADPKIEDATTLAGNCGADSQPESPEAAQVHTQGCYVNGRIHLLADRGQGRELLYVVATHELLHAVYASLGPEERARIDAETEAAQAGNERLEERLRPYGTGPTLRNEIHSILGSEFAGLSPALEAHYAEYLGDRGRVVAARRRVLGDREDRIRTLKAEVGQLDDRITSLKDASAALRARGDIRGYNANVAVINLLISRYNAEAADLNARIDEYNALLGG